ncbi:hypothetical protein RJ639_040983 [Escallonia herrerae]|uniref:Uncharacterized protein n=1 Tax=Escallonia herrerae TaxID=1293975 RepID=A0AA89B3E7_9ASTE|nr:hypothetical protein RJ639_040983 [Escallonia herrerae]
MECEVTMAAADLPSTEESDLLVRSTKKYKHSLPDSDANPNPSGVIDPIPQIKSSFVETLSKSSLYCRDEEDAENEMETIKAQASEIESQEITSTLAWVLFSELSIEYFDEEIMMRMGTTLGTAVKADKQAADSARGKFAQLCIELDPSKPLIPKVWLNGHLQNVEYQGLHAVCFHCGRYGHKLESYLSLRKTPPDFHHAPIEEQDDGSSGMNVGNGSNLSPTHDPGMIFSAYSIVPNPFEPKLNSINLSTPHALAHEPVNPSTSPLPEVASLPRPPDGNSEHIESSSKENTHPFTHANGNLHKDGMNKSDANLEVVQGNATCLRNLVELVKTYNPEIFVLMEVRVEGHNLNDILRRT